MRAAVLSQFGPPGVHSIENLEDPMAGPGQLLLRVRACGVCGEDVLARRGDLPHFASRLPVVQGHELAGEVIAVGSATDSGWLHKQVIVGQSSTCHNCAACRAGQEPLCERPTIYGQDRGGGYADHVVIEATDAIVVPDDMPFEAAALAGCAIGVGVRALRHASLSPGDTVLVTGASGGVGVHALQVARAYGINTLAVTSSPQKADVLSQYATSVIVGTSDFAAKARSMGARPEAVVELTAGLTFAQSSRVVARGGRIIVVGNVDPRPLTLHSGALIAREMIVHGSAGASRSDIEEGLRLMSEGAIKPVIAATFDLARVGDAHRFQEKSSQVGRVVLTHG